MNNIAPVPPAQGFADATTPLVKNCWYIAGLASEITRAPRARRILGVDVALYRTLAGAPVAVRNRCPHRSFPLAKGRLEGDELVCLYHGMRFAPSGQCTKMPALPLAPASAAVRSFPVAERGPLVWIWPGNPDHADEDLIPDTSWLSDPLWASVTGQFHMRADYVSMHENLLDQTHFPFLHPGTVGTPDFVRSTLDVREENGMVIIDRSLPNSPPPGIYAMPMDMAGQPVNRFSEARFASPAMHVAFARLTDIDRPGETKREWRFNITHLITPETNNSLHYWWFCSRNTRLEDKAVDRFMYEGSNQAYTEDVEALQWITETILQDETPQLDLNFAPDKPGLLMRRRLRYLADLEAGLLG
ncbi:aromatic ring-hydroxylating dioxygenase subunit alpha [Acidocella sp.]|uniref:aromatic ring-hydroxylating dioxygenase subunit alpha n=1 Tax=Acidocella sp. TaxID=50710 RepID=UPI00262B2F92|nr:aromatic ring-hydroxylating dioxygenase subunit alpha [Acidocella sp.]